MKDIIRKVIDKFGQGKIRYSVITFGSVPSVRLRFTNSFPNDADLKRVLDNIPQTQGNAALDKALEEAKKLFDAATRPNVTNVLVVIMDKSSTSQPKEVEDAAEPLKTSGIKIVTISLGNESDPTELERAATSKDDVINANETDSPKKLAETIMSKVVERKCIHKERFRFQICDIFGNCSKDLVNCQEKQ